MLRKLLFFITAISMLYGCTTNGVMGAKPTENEKKILIALSPEKGKAYIEKGELSEGQLVQLEYLRWVEDTLEERYPDAKFEIESMQMSHNFRNDDRFYVTDESGTERMVSITYDEDHNKIWADNCYSYKFEGDINDSLVAILKKAGIEHPAVKTVFSTPVGEEVVNFNTLADLAKTKKKIYYTSTMFVNESEYDKKMHFELTKNITKQTPSYKNIISHFVVYLVPEGTPMDDVKVLEALAKANSFEKIIAVG